MRYAALSKRMTKFVIGEGIHHMHFLRPQLAPSCIWFDLPIRVRDSHEAVLASNSGLQSWMNEIGVLYSNAIFFHHHRDSANKLHGPLPAVFSFASVARRFCCVSSVAKATRFFLAVRKAISNVVPIRRALCPLVPVLPRGRSNEPLSGYKIRFGRFEGVAANASRCRVCHSSNLNLLHQLPQTAGFPCCVTG